MREIDNQPEYEFRHKQRVLLNYNGVASEQMQINNRTADKFMQVSDMRSNIVIEKKIEQRVQDYDEIGNVRVGKFIKLPKIGEWTGKGITQTKNEDNIYHVAIDDQELARTVARANDGDGSQFNDRFITAFNKEVNKGIRTCLINEKILNRGQHSLAYTYSLFNTAVWNLSIGPSWIGSELIMNEDPSSRAEGMLIAATFIALMNVKNQAVNLGHAAIDSLPFFKSQSNYRFGRTNYEDPIVRHSIPEYIMPGVPLDRLARGAFYLANHDLIEKNLE